MQSPKFPVNNAGVRLLSNSTVSPAEFVPVTYVSPESAETGEMVLRMAREDSSAVDHEAMREGFRAIVKTAGLIDIWKLSQVNRRMRNSRIKGCFRILVENEYVWYLWLREVL